MYTRLRGYLPQGSFFAFLFLAVALSVLSGCNNATASEPEMGSGFERPRLFTGADSAVVAALEARIAALEGAVVVSTGDTKFKVSGEEVFEVYDAGSATGAHLFGKLTVSPVLGSSGPALVVGDADVNFATGGFEKQADLVKNQSGLRLVWASQNLLGQYTYHTASVMVGGADSGGLGFRLLRIAN